MKDRLEKFVSEHRDEFDVYEPRTELWQEICHELPVPPKEEKEGKVINIKFGDRASFSADYFFMRVAAAIVLLLGCGLTLFLMKQQTPEATSAIAVTQPRAIERIAPELVEVEAYYVSQIKEKKSQLSEYDLKLLGLDEDQEIDRELARLDSSYLQLKKQLITTPNTEEIVGAMIQNLQIRIEVLNRQLEILQNLEKLEQNLNNELKENETTNV